MLDALEEPFPLGSAEVAMLASVGRRRSRTTPETDPETMLREADVAMYQAKGAGGRRLELFDEGLRREMSAQVELERAPARGAAAPGAGARLPADPAARGRTGGRLRGARALASRGATESRIDELLPATFLPPAEDSELIVQIGRWVLHTACEQAEPPGGARASSIPISVNISARELTELDLAERVREELAYCRLPGRALCLEVSEDVVLRDPERAREALTDVQAPRRLDRARQLRRRPVHAQPAEQPAARRRQARPRADPRASTATRRRRAMFAATIALAKEAGLTAVAVGIETNRQLALARELDCSVGQGFLLQGPASAERLRLRDPAGAVTSAPWRPLVRLGGGSRRH